VLPVDKVQIQRTQTDVGVVYGNGSNAYVVTGNYLLISDSHDALMPVAETLYEILQAATYTPCKVVMPAGLAVQPGDVVQVTDGNGRAVSVYVMTKILRGQRQTLESTGNALRDSVEVTNNLAFSDLQGKVMELQTDMNGFRVENWDRDEKLSKLELSVDSIKTKVSTQETGLEQVINRVSMAEQTAEGLSLRVRSIVEDGAGRVVTSAGYTFDETGLTVRKSGKEIKTQITENGMTVYKNNNAVLTANSEGVNAVDLHASTYLIVGGRSRFENYGTDRTGCFWIGG